MAAPSPIQFTDLRGIRHVEPSVTGFIELQTEETVHPDLVNDLVILSNFRSGKPGQLTRFSSFAALQNTHDPDRTGDQGVALAKMAKNGFADEGIFGAADILTVRVDPATPSTVNVLSGATVLGTITTSDYGAQTRRDQKRLQAGTHVGKKLTLSIPGRVPLVGDDLGPMLTVHYVGVNADGTGKASAATLTIRRAGALITYAQQVNDGDWLEINGIPFEFQTTLANTTQGRNGVQIGTDKNASFANLTAAIGPLVPGVTAVQSTSAGTVTLSAAEEGVAVLLHTGIFTIAASGDPASLRTTLTAATDGSADLAIPLTSPFYSTIQLLAAYINSQPGYTATIAPYANKFLASAGLDVLTGQDIRTAAVVLTGYMEAIADWVNHQTRGQFSMTIASRAEPDEDTVPVAFTGGLSPLETATDFDNALGVVANGLQLGGILLVNTDDPAIMAMVVAFVRDQQALGKWFRAYFGAQPALATQQGSTWDVTEYLTIASSLDNTDCRLVVQRLQVLGDSGQLVDLHPLYFAAALAGGSAGNAPWNNPLTNKRLAVAGLSDDFDLATRESLLAGGVIVAKKEQNSIIVDMAVTTSQDPTRRMPRIVADADAVRNFDSDVRAAFLPIRGTWANGSTNATVIARMMALAEVYIERGVFVAGQDDFGNPRPAFQLGNPPSVIEAGVLKIINYNAYIGGEIDHVSEQGNANYQRLVGSLTATAGPQPFSQSVVI